MEFLFSDFQSVLFLTLLFKQQPDRTNSDCKAGKTGTGCTSHIPGRPGKSGGNGANGGDGGKSGKTETFII